MEKTLSLIILITLLYFTPGCYRNNGTAESESSLFKVIYGLPTYTIRNDSLSICIPGKSNVSLPTNYYIKTPKTFSVNMSNNKEIFGKKIQIKQVIKYTPGEDTIKLPTINQAKYTKNLAGYPDFIVAPAPYIKDPNPYTFFSYGKLQGLKHNDIRCLLQDKKGNIWFSSPGGVTKFDGKFFLHYSEEEGLKNEVMRSIFEDSKGNIWFGTTGGVTKFDGLYFTHFTAKDGLANDVVRSICEDRKGNIWFGTYGGGISMHDGKNFTNYSVKQGLSNNNIMSIIEDRKGNIWIASDGGSLTKFDGKSFYHYTSKEGLSNNYIFSIIEDRKGNIWLATDGGGVIKFDGQFFTSYTTNEGLSNNSVRAIMEDSKGTIWIGTWGGGINKLYGDTIMYFNQNDGLANDYIFSLLEDRSGNLWIGTYGGGVSKMNDETFIHYSEKQGLSNALIRSIFEDVDGTLWFGSEEGLNKYDGRTIIQYTVKDGLSNNVVKSIFRDSKKNLWIGTDGGLNRFDGKCFSHITQEQGLSNNIIKVIFEDRNGNLWIGTEGGGLNKICGDSIVHITNKTGLPSNVVRCIIEDKFGNLWIGTDQGVAILKDNVITILTEKEGLLRNSVWSIQEDKYGNIWIGTNGGGIFIILNKTIKNNYTHNGNNKPLNELNGRISLNITENNGLAGNNIFSMMFDREGDLYIGTRFGVSFLDGRYIESMMNSNKIIPKNFKFKFNNYTYEEGFLGVGVNGGITICESNDGTIWFGSNDRLTAFQPKMNKPDTIPPFVEINYIELFNERINWFDFVNSKNEKLVFKDTVITLKSGVKIQHCYFDSINTINRLPENLSLSYKNNNITFNFIGISLKHNNKIVYEYKLDGYDQNWIISTNRNSVNYSNLPAGNYTFRLKAQNNSGYWSKEVMYRFEIKKPWWQSSWFRILIALVISILLFSIYRIRISTLTKQKRRLENLVTEKTIIVKNQNSELYNLNQELTASNEHLNSTIDELNTANDTLFLTNEDLNKQSEELRHALIELKNTQNQLIQFEKMASLGILSAGIAHEINNPLNFIKGGVVGLEAMLKSITNDHFEMFVPYLDAIDLGVDRAAEIVKSLAAYCRKEDLIRTDCSVQSIINNCLVILNNEINDRIEVIKEYYENEPLIKGDEGKLHQVFLNILLNSVQAILTNGVITIKTELIEKFFIISIKDTGCGIPEENISKIFDPFFTTKDPGKGTGLGLSITQKIIFEHNGTIDYVSQLNVGTISIIKLSLSN